MVKATQIKVFYNELSNEKRQKDSSLGCKVVIILFLMLKHGDCSGLENSDNFWKQVKKYTEAEKNAFELSIQRQNYSTGQSSNPQQSNAPNRQSSNPQQSNAPNRQSSNLQQSNAPNRQSSRQHIDYNEPEVNLYVKYNKKNSKFMARLNSETLLDLKTKISEHDRMPKDTDHILLLFNGQLLKGDKKLSYYQIKNESTLEVPTYKSTFVDVTIHYSNVKSTKYTFHVMVAPQYHTVSDLKKIISKHIYITAPVREQRLYFFPNNVEVLLDDSNEDTLASYGILEGSEIKLFVSNLF